MNFHDILIIGAGASGLTSAITAKDFGCDVAIIESTSRIGNKILTTGNGRCNISNNKISASSVGYQSGTENFVQNTLNNFSVEDTKNFFLSLGLPFCELENEKLFPKSLQASSVVDILKMSIEEREIPIYYNSKVKLIKKANKFIIETQDNTFSCNKLIIASGGKSAPKTGSDGSLYKICESLGHKVIEPVPGIVQLKLRYPYLRAMAGIKLNSTVYLMINDKLLRKESGEILFTDYGISGPPILQVSSLASRSLKNKDSVKLVIDIMPDISPSEVSDFILGHLAMFPQRSISTALIGIVNKKLIPTLLKDINVDSIHIPCDELSWKLKNKLCKRLKEWTFDCTDTNGFNNAQLTVGGIDTSYVNSSTLESTILKNLFFCGEVLDVNGDCGGYNLQWAWSSGFIAGSSASKSKLL